MGLLLHAIPSFSLFSLSVFVTIFVGCCRYVGVDVYRGIKFSPSPLEGCDCEFRFWVYIQYILDKQLIGESLTNTLTSNTNSSDTSLSEA